jgi:sensor histidine kinase regulating citrate/malate metabolism
MVSIGLSIGTISLLLSNIIVFFVYELTRRTQAKFTQIQLEQQRERISTEYYELLLEKQENQKILVHDIKRHLQHIQNIAQQAEVQQYTAMLCGEFGLSDVIAYSGNKYVDVIINRYAQSCKSKGIDLEADMQGVSLDFMSDMDITALFDNLLENAFEAASKTDNGYVRLFFCRENENYVVINTQNSCAHVPIVKGGRILSSKRSGQTHGIGLKSIYRIANKYNGSVEWQYCDERKTFDVVVVLERA